MTTTLTTPSAAGEDMLRRPKRGYAPAAPAELPALRVAAWEQWISTSASRPAPDGYSWMQAVHWVLGSGLYRPSRNHGPKFTKTTVNIARLLADLTPCRPGVEYLQRLTGLSRRTVQYHLEMLREAGLLAYQEKGTRVRGLGRRASEMVRVIPPVFDTALGVRTVGEGRERRACGLAEAGRSLMGRLGKRAAVKARRKPRPSTSAKGPTSRQETDAQKTVAHNRRCTPMGGGCSTSSTAGTTSTPPETSKLASGLSNSPTPHGRTPKRPRTLNQVGRRYQLARELTQTIDWLAPAAIPRIAWVARHVADAGWSVTDVQAWIAWVGGAQHALRPSGLLAQLLKHATTSIDTDDKRRQLRNDWLEKQRIRSSHQWKALDEDWTMPASPQVRQEVTAALQHVADHGQAAPAIEQTTDADALTAEVSAEELEVLRREMWNQYLGGDLSLITSAIDLLGAEEARRLYGAALVDPALRQQSSSLTRLGFGERAQAAYALPGPRRTRQGAFA